MWNEKWESEIPFIVFFKVYKRQVSFTVFFADLLTFLLLFPYYSLTIALLFSYYSLTITIRFPYRSYTAAIPETGIRQTIHALRSLRGTRGRRPQNNATKPKAFVEQLNKKGADCSAPPAT